MSNITNKNISVPLSIELLFNNEKLDLMKILCLMYAFMLESKKRRKVSEIMFYYSLVNFDLIKLFEKSEENNKSFTPSSNLYFRFQTKVNGILLNMSHLQLINLQGDLNKKLDDITVQLNPQGKLIFEEMDSVFFSNLKKEYTNAFKKVKFSASNMQVIKGIRQ
ncbi:hypothetical protein BW900_29835 [Bacillus mycoides]|uniref:Uncharacterized protein n=1 Tax=Bacillus mycoides TaxID=1405 RepID=A0A1S9SYS7_BACMY|nr:hypothetical protein [Bacillus mycoides]OOR02915.1 hypothetical protein BW900_29835 [Bacillus mycoides]